MKQIAGIALLALGVWIIAVYWVYWIRVAMMKLGYGRVGFSSMSPLVGPILIVLGGVIAGDPIADVVGPWVFLIDPNTYVLLVSLAVLAWKNLRRPPD